MSVRATTVQHAVPPGAEAAAPVQSVTVIVCTRNPGPPIRATVASVLASPGPPLSLCLVDQSDDDQVPAALGDLMRNPRLQYIACAERGLSIGRNRGVAAATTEWLAFTDDDCVVTPSWLAEIVAPFQFDGRIGVVFGTVKPAPYDPALGFLPNYTRTTPFLARSIFDKHQVEGIGASMALRKSTWCALHGFDEALGAGAPMHAAEETDVVMRALLSGWFVYETPGAAVIHSGFRTWSQAPRVLRNYLHGIGAALAKLVKLGHWQVFAVFARLAMRWIFSRPVVDMGTQAHRRARLSGFLTGVAAGLRTPVDARTGHFRRDRVRAAIATTGAAGPVEPPRETLDAVIADRSPGTLPPASVPATAERVSIVMPNWNARPFVIRALTSLVVHTTYPYELIIVDNGSTDGSQDVIREFLRAHPEVDARFIENPENRYFSVACNQGFAAASPDTKYLALYCNDCEAKSDTWLQDLVSAIQPDDTIAAGHAAIRPITDRYRGVYFSYDPVYPDPALKPRMVSLMQRQGGMMQLYGYCYLLKRALVQRTGLFLYTGPFEQYHSDWELYVRFAAYGYRIAPMDLQVHHWHSISELIGRYPDLYRDLVERLEDPATLARYLEAGGRPMYEAEAGFLERYPTAAARALARLRRRLGWSW